MTNRSFSPYFESLETRRLFAWSGYTTLIDQDDAISRYPRITGAGVTVAVIDTGIDYTHPNLGAGFGSGLKVIGGYDFYDDDADPMDTDGHGTAVAGVIAAKRFTHNGVTYQGVAPDAKLVALRVGTEDNLLTSNIEQALRWVIDRYKSLKIGVVNLSIGSGNYADSRTDSILSDELAELRGLGVLVIAASGNSNDQISGPISEDGIAFPAADPNVLAVGAVDSRDVITSWTQRGDELDMLAPGVGIIAPNEGGGYASVDGTSFAAPHVSGAAALLKQADRNATAGDIGSILMSAGRNNRDGRGESGNTTSLQFSRLDIDAALSLSYQRRGKTSSVNLGTVFDTALDSQGVLHAAFYDPRHADVLYATRSVSGMWSSTRAIDSIGDVGSQLSIAVDTTGKPGIAYYDATNSAVRYASFNGVTWSNKTIESSKWVGTSPSLGYDIDGNAYLAYYRRSGGNLRLSILDRDSGRWERITVDGLDGADVGSDLSLDVGEAALRNGPFTVYDTTVAIAYADRTNGNLKYARLDVDDPGATWFIAVVDDTQGVANIDLDLHPGPSNSNLQAQIAYQDTESADVKYAFRNTDWFVEPVATRGTVGAVVQLSFSAGDSPMVTYYSSTKRAIYTATRLGRNRWSTSWDATSYSVMRVSLNERSNQVLLSYLTRDRTAVLTSELV
jgi:subtilisin family serine protease